MKKITLSMDEELLQAGREYAQAHNISFNALVRDLVRRTVKSDSSIWVSEMIQNMRNSAGNSRGKEWCRKDSYEC
jgi:hypothetical protein